MFHGDGFDGVSSEAFFRSNMLFAVLADSNATALEQPLLATGGNCDQLQFVGHFPIFLSSRARRGVDRLTQAPRLHVTSVLLTDAPLFRVLSGSLSRTLAYSSRMPLDSIRCAVVPARIIS